MKHRISLNALISRILSPFSKYRIVKLSSNKYVAQALVRNLEFGNSCVWRDIAGKADRNAYQLYVYEFKGHVVGSFCENKTHALDRIYAYKELLKQQKRDRNNSREVIVEYL